MSEFGPTKAETRDLILLLFVIILGTAMSTALIFYMVAVNHHTWGVWLLSMGIGAEVGMTWLGVLALNDLIHRVMFRVYIEESQRMSEFVDEIVKIYGGVKEDESAS